MRVSAWTYIILGCLFAALSVFFVGYGWHKLGNETLAKQYKDIEKDIKEIKKLASNDPEKIRQAEHALEEGKFEQARKLIQTVKQRTQQEFRDHLYKSLEVLEKNVINFKKGDQTAWLTIGAQLYILLCDKSKGPVLTERVIPNFSLHPLLSDLSHQEGKYLLYTTKMVFRPDGITLELFNLKNPKIPLGKWLQQTVAILNIGEKGIPITIGGLIQEVWDQAGPGHFDPDVRETLQATSGGKFVEKGIENPLHVKYLVSIADYIVPEIRQQLPSQ